MKKGLFITVEGTDGSGKTTQLKLLEEFLRSRSDRVVVTREPGGCEISERIRELLLDGKNAGMSPRCEALLFAAARAQHVQDTILPELERGGIVLCSRFVHSSLAYQGYAREIGVELIRGINDFALNGLKPDLVLMLTVSAETARQRRIARGKPDDRLESESSDFFERVLKGFYALAESDESIALIDAESSINEVHEHIKKTITERFGI